MTPTRWRTAPATALAKAGGDSWFFLTADYAFGAALERDTTAAVKAAGGKVVGGVKHPLSTSDFSSFLLQAQASKAKIIGLANAGADTTNSIKQAAEFGIVAGGQKLAALLLFITDVHSLGLNTAQGLNFTETFYWDLNDQNRAFAKRFQERMKNHGMPTMVHAGVYAGLLHYFKALEALGGNPHDGAKVVAKMKELPTDDPLFGKGSIEPNGRTIHPGLSVRGQEALRVQRPLGLLQAGRHHSRGRSLYAAGQEHLSLAEKVNPGVRRHRRRTFPSETLSARQNHAGPLRPIAGRTDQRLVLRAAQSRARRDLRDAQHHQFRPWRALHDGRVLRVFPAQPGRYRILAGADPGADRGRYFRHDPRADHAAMADRPRSSLRAVADVRPGADHPGRVSELFSVPPACLMRSRIEFKGGMNLGFMFLPIYRGWVVIFSLVVCLLTWYLIERTRLGANLRAATENPTLVRAFGINVPRMITLTYGLGVGLAALAGVFSAPINQVRPLMGADLIIVVFAVVVIGGMGSIMGSIITGFALGVIEGIDEVLLSRSLQHRGIRADGAGVAGEANGTDGTGKLT